MAAKEPNLRKLVSTSKVLDANLKRYWLSVLDHLTPASKKRLEAILSEDTDVGRGLAPRH